MSLDGTFEKWDGQPLFTEDLGGFEKWDGQPFWVCPYAAPVVAASWGGTWGG